MFSRTHTTRRWVTALLLAIYGSAGVLGYGLHELFHAHHHGHGHTHGLACHGGACHGGTCHGTAHANSHATEKSLTLLERLELAAGQSTCSCSSHCQTASQTQHQTPTLKEPMKTGSSLSGVEGPCSICEFLAQAQQPVPTVTTNTLVTALPTIPPATEIIAPLFLPAEQLARGPPQLLA